MQYECVRVYVCIHTCTIRLGSHPLITNTCFNGIENSCWYFIHFLLLLWLQPQTDRQTDRQTDIQTWLPVPHSLANRRHFTHAHIHSRVPTQRECNVNISDTLLTRLASPRNVLASDGCKLKACEYSCAAWLCCPSTYVMYACMNEWIYVYNICLCVCVCVCMYGA